MSGRDVDDMIYTLLESSYRNLVSEAEVEAALGDAIPSADVPALISRASELVQDHCGRLFAPTRYRQEWAFRRDATTDRQREYLVFARTPVLGSYSVPPFADQVDANTDFAQPLTIEVDGEATTLFEYEHWSGRLFRLTEPGGARTLWPGVRVVAEYTAGYGPPSDDDRFTVTTPAVVREVCLELIAAAFHNKGRDGAVQTDETVGVGRLTFFDRGAAASGGAMALTPDQTARLRKFVTLSTN
jgi:hypothetical protein